MKKLGFLTAIFTVLASNIFAVPVSNDKATDDHQVTISIPKVALLDLEGTKDITLKVEGPSEAGRQ